MNFPDLNLLLTFDAMLREGSVTGAAERMNLSIPAMSRRLANLRETMGDPLFVLAGRRLVPTPLALELAPQVHDLLEDARNVLGNKQQLNLGTIKRVFTLRAEDGFTGAWALRLSQRVAEQAPHVTLRFMSQGNEDVAALRDGLSDLDIGIAGPLGPEVYKQRLYIDSFVGVVNNQHPLARLAHVSAQDLVSYPHLSVSRRGRTRGPLDLELEKIGLQRKVPLVVPGFQAAMQLASTSELVAVIPRRFVEWSLPLLPLSIFTLPVVTPSGEFSQAWHPRVNNDQVHRWLRQQVQECSSS
ncbi:MULTISPECIES: LysR family transcriptional regulator [Pseudomonas]|uniref:LysR family transcriptional regulator n=1 Tax=Pseudomonas piscis TaxID=2614538 RepID=A0A7X1U5V6_9PSED|nr:MULTISPECIES: LysR family transcriptional regulator [Pseudomonas]MQA55453.1 LysR family transcriptional regulator [Pseudomonas piscis]POA56755.1 transcriptional regulator [Pseudomonas sp. FW507-12TSA]WMN16421.1 LysR family transcriptional regulator [Pseudomonas piscis]